MKAGNLPSPLPLAGWLEKTEKDTSMIHLEPAIHLLKSHLEELSPVVTSQLKELVKDLSAWWADDENVAFYRFEIHADGHHITFGDVDLFHGALCEPFMNSMPLLPENKFFLDIENFSNFEEIESAFTTYHAAQSEIFFSWFADCFIKAGGQKLEKPVLMSYRDDVDHYDLKTKKWVKPQEIMALISLKGLEEIIPVERVYSATQKKWMHLWCN